MVNGQAYQAIKEAKAQVYDKGVHVEDLEDDTKVLLYASDYEADRIIQAFDPLIRKLTKAIYIGSSFIGTGFLGNVILQVLNQFVFLP